MKASIIMALLILFLSFAVPGVLAEEDIKERGRYIYDDADQLTLESELALSSYLLGMDKKTDYEIVLVFPMETMTTESMTEWYNQKGVGKMTADNGLAVFIFPDNTAYGLIGNGHDRIAVPAVSTYGERTLSGLEDEPVLAILNFLNVLRDMIDKPTTSERASAIGEDIILNFDIIALYLFGISLIIFLYQQRDGFQWSDFKVPMIFLVIAVVSVGIVAMGSAYSSNIEREYGVITSISQGSYSYTTQQPISTGKSTTYITVFHTMYTNDVKLISYDFKEYDYRFTSSDNKRAWQRNVGEFVQLNINIEENSLSSVSVPINDNSGGHTNGYGTWINTNR